METTPKTIEQIALEIVGKIYTEFEYDRRFVRHLVATVEDPTMAVIPYEGAASPAAQWVYASLWSGYEGGYEPAATATCNLFYTLGRQNELGRIESQFPEYRFEG